MSASNQILPFCPTDTGTNLESQADYAVDSNRTNGNQPGVASSQLNNKAIRQATYMAAGLGSALVAINDMSVLDNNTSAQILAQLLAAIERLPPRITTVTATGAGTYNLPYAFYIASGSCTAAATYSDGTTTFTVLATVSGATKVYMSGAAKPITATGSGTLTKTAGTGDATLTYYAIRIPVMLEVEGVGPGGGGAASITNNGSDGSAATTFGTSTFSAGPGLGGVSGSSTCVGGAGGTATLNGGTGRAVDGANGDTGQVAGANTINLKGGNGGASYYGGNGVTQVSTAGVAAKANSGSGGGGGAQGSASTGGGGGAGGWFRGFISDPSSTSTWGYVVGAKGGGGSAGSQAGAAGGDGALLIIAHFQ